jgi:hypothetical protein
LVNGCCGRGKILERRVNETIQECADIEHFRRTMSRFH